MKILGVDPGTTRVGYGIIELGSQPAYVDCGVFEPPFSASGLRLRFMADKLEQLIELHKPACAAVEKLYFSTNKKTALSVAEARGVILLTLTRNKIPIIEFAPNQVKSMVAGWGKSDKKGISKAVNITLRIPDSPNILDDATDALALALCGYFEIKAGNKGG